MATSTVTPTIEDLETLELEAYQEYARCVFNETPERAEQAYAHATGATDMVLEAKRAARRAVQA